MKTLKQYFRIAALVAVQPLAACDDSAKKADNIAHDAVIEGSTATLSFAFDEVPQTKSDTEWLILGFQ